MNAAPNKLSAGERLRAALFDAREAVFDLMGEIRTDAPVPIDLADLRHSVTALEDVVSFVGAITTHAARHGVLPAAAPVPTAAAKRSPLTVIKGGA